MRCGESVEEAGFDVGEFSGGPSGCGTGPVDGDELIGGDGAVDDAFDRPGGRAGTESGCDGPCEVVAGERGAVGSEGAGDVGDPFVG